MVFCRRWMRSCGYRRARIRPTWPSCTKRARASRNTLQSSRVSSCELQDCGLTWLCSFFVSLAPWQRGMLATRNPRNSAARNCSNSQLRWRATEPDQFIVKHYAGDVQYDVKDFLVKNQVSFSVKFAVIVGLLVGQLLLTGHSLFNPSCFPSALTHWVSLVLCRRIACWTICTRWCRAPRTNSCNRFAASG